MRRHEKPKGRSPAEVLRRAIALGPMTPAEKHFHEAAVARKRAQDEAARSASPQGRLPV